jgi:hypothetical protein
MTPAIRPVRPLAWTRLVLAAGLLVLPAVALAQEEPGPPPPSFNFNPPPRNALVGDSGPQWGAGDGVGRFSGIAYEREIVPRLVARLQFGQSYNGDGDERFQDYLLNGTPVRQIDVIDFTRLELGAQLGLVQPVSRGARVMVFAGPVFTRASERFTTYIQDLRFGDVFEAGRETVSENVTGMLYSAGLEFDMADNFAYRVMVLHNRAGRQNPTTLAIGGAVKF